MKKNKEIIYGYGIPREFDLSIKNVTAITKRVYKNCGKFIKRYEIDKGGGGISINMFRPSKDRLTGAMYEFENLFFVVWSCGEYIDSAFFIREVKTK